MAHKLAALADHDDDPYADGYDMAIEQCLEIIRRWQYSEQPVAQLLNAIDALADE